MNHLAIRRAACLFFAFFPLLLTFRVASAQELLSNGTFDVDINGWTVNPDISNDGTIDWVAMQGLPPGSLRFPSEGQVALPQECFQMYPGVFKFNADVFMETSGEFVDCHINYYLYTENDDCTGGYAWFINTDQSQPVPGMTLMNEWETLDFDLPMDAGSIKDFGFPSIRPVIIKDGDIGGDDACLFDNVSFQFVPEAPGPSSIPALSTTGMATLATLLAIAGMGVVRRSFVRP
jgi:hypothetical protein